MRLTILGTAGVVPDPQRAQSGYLLEKAGRLALIDCGSGVFCRLANLSINWAHLDTFFLTHHHLDHMSDLLSILTARWLLGMPNATLYGPQDTREFIKKLPGSHQSSLERIALLHVACLPVLPNSCTMRAICLTP